MQRSQECGEAEGDQHCSDATVGIGDQIRERIATAAVVLSRLGGGQRCVIGVRGSHELEGHRLCVRVLRGIGIVGQPFREGVLGDLAGYFRAVAHDDDLAPPGATAEVRVLEAQRTRVVGRGNRRDPAADDAQRRQPAVAVFPQRRRREARRHDLGAVEQEIEPVRQRRAVAVRIGLDPVAVGLGRGLGETEDVVEFDLVGRYPNRGVSIDREWPEFVGHAHRRSEQQDDAGDDGGDRAPSAPESNSARVPAGTCTLGWSCHV